MVDSLQISEFGRQAEDGDEGVWIDVWQDYFIDCVAGFLVFTEGFLDVMFILTQFARPNNGGLATGSTALIITLVSSESPA